MLTGQAPRGGYTYRNRHGRQRPLGIATLEDKIVQRAVVEVLNAIYEEDFLGFSYGFRPGRSPHHALDALSVGISERKVNWVLDADISDFFSTLDRTWLRWSVKASHWRQKDPATHRQVVGRRSHRGWEMVRSVQGASVSPLSANVYLHYVFDRWVRQWRQRHARGDMIVSRFADDFVVGFQNLGDARQFLHDLRERFAKFNLELHPDKTRLIEFGRFAASNRRERGLKKPETFDFLGFTHICGRTRDGRFWLRRVTIAKLLLAKLKQAKTELRRRRHRSIPEQRQWLASVLRGHINYYAVPGSIDAVSAFRDQVIRLWRETLRRRSQRS